MKSGRNRSHVSPFAVRRLTASARLARPDLFPSPSSSEIRDAISYFFSSLMSFF
jgi:hypothetical protein